MMNTVLSRRSTRILESVMGIGTLVAGLVFLRIVHDSPSPYGDPGYIGSAAFFPGLIALLVAALGVVLILMAWRPHPPTLIKTGRTARALLAYLLMIVVVAGLPWLGIWLTSMLAVPLLALLFGERRWGILLILAIVPPVLVIHLFEGVMGIYFPRGGLL